MKLFLVNKKYKNLIIHSLFGKKKKRINWKKPKCSFLSFVSSFLTLLLFLLRGLLARSVLQAQAASPIFTHVYAAVVAIINSKFPQIGELILKRLILNFRKSYRRNLKVNQD